MNEQIELKALRSELFNLKQENKQLKQIVKLLRTQISYIKNSRNINS